MKYVSVAEMVAIEREANSLGYSYSEMMESAGKGLAAVVNEVYGDNQKRMVIGLVGSGNNGGDTLVALTYLQAWDWQTAAYLVKERPSDDPLVNRASDSGCRIIHLFSDLKNHALTKVLKTSTVFLDGLLGTGIHLPLRGKVAEVLTFIKDTIREDHQKIHVVAVDCPSGVDCDTGEAASEAIPAEITVTMAAVKEGLLKFPAYNLVGELRCIDIGLPSGLSSHDAIRRDIVVEDWVRSQLPVRPLNAHKSTFGVVMVIAGSQHYCGAVVLAGEAAFRSGAGWVTLAVPEPLQAALSGRFIEATWLPLPHQEGWIAGQASKAILQNLDRVTTLVVGPGLGLMETTQEFLTHLLEAGQGVIPDMVIDADGLKILSRIPGWHRLLPAPAVLTPHPGEMAVLTGETIQDINQHRIEVAETYAKIWGHVVVLKGAFTVIASPEGQTAILPIATPALARAGTGDVLAGLIGGLRAQGLAAYQAAIVGAWIHAKAGLHAAKVLGNSASVLAGDVLAAIKDVLTRMTQN
jgi:NAD(P)H-hydrate epimerase